MRVAIVGLGAATYRGHLPALERLAAAGALELVGAADSDGSALDRAVHSLPRVPLFSNAEAMLDAVECDLLVVAAEPRAHERLVSHALDRRLHVLCEKPLVLTRRAYDRIAHACARQPEAGLVSVHQYRYSPGWIVMARWARQAARLRIPFAVTAEVEREAVDAYAARPWRLDVDRSGGMLADHGVHFLALAWSVDQDLEVLAAARSSSETAERSSALVRLGSGALTLRLRRGADGRNTRLAFEASNVSLTWSGPTLSFGLRQRSVLSRNVPALADRKHVDSLYAPLYRDVARNLTRAAWRTQRRAETLGVARALVALLEGAQSRRDGAPATS